MHEKNAGTLKGEQSTFPRKGAKTEFFLMFEKNRNYENFSCLTMVAV